jgi:spore coat protein U-like protein
MWLRVGLLVVRGKPIGWLATALTLLCAVLPSAQAQSCNVGGTAVSFGQYSSLNTSPGFGIGNISVTCNTQPIQVSVPFTVALSAGNAGSFGGARLLRLGTNTLQYQLFTSTNLQTVWGDGTGGTQVVAGSTTVASGFGSIANLLVYGGIAAGQNVPRGLYSDTLVITLSF